MTTAVAAAVEIVSMQPELDRWAGWVSALRDSAHRVGLRVVHSRAYRGDQPWLLFWGPGAPERAATMRQHVATGGRAIAMDLAYWDRLRKARFAIDAAHPQATIMSMAWPSDRFVSDRVPVRNVWDPTGPILFAGLGPKAYRQYGEKVGLWEAEMMRACRARWPTRPILYRPKKMWQSAPTGCTPASTRPIDEALAGVSLVVTWHSNVAVDAIRMGIPAICRDGAAAAVCAPALGDEDPRPLPVSVRDQFLANLAWYQWAPEEAESCWRFLLEVLS